jgi:multiple sugar transport system substrate-binding protein
MTMTPMSPTREKAMTITRRHAVALAGMSALPLRAQGRTLTAFGHRVHQTAATTGPGGDATEAWRRETGTAVNWVTLGDVAAIHERLLREASLNETSLDVAFLLNGRAVPRTLRLFEPLDALQAEAPIEALEDFAPGLVEPFRLDGAVHGIPVRHATNALIYNEALFEERGVALPRSFEELTEAMRRLTFRRADGTQVHGLAFTPVFASNFLTIARCLGADYMTADRRITAAEPPMVQAMTVLAELFRAGVLPRNTPTLTNEEIATWMQQGRAAITVNPYARLVPFNNPQQSRYPGRIKALLPPMAADLSGRVPYASTVEFWSLALPRNGRQKPLAWQLVRALSSRAGTLAMALNGNGATRISTYREPTLVQVLPHAAAEAAALADARIHLPAFDEQARAHDIFVEESQAAMLGMKDPARAMADATARVRPLLG